MKIDFFALPSDNMRSRVMTGAIHTGIAQGVKAGVQILSVLVLSRLLPPAEFGIVAMVGPILGFVQMFQDLGLGQATIQKQTLTPEEASNLFWIGAIFGVLLAVLMAAASPAVAWFYGAPETAALCAAMSLLLVVSSLGVQHNALLGRAMQFRYLALLEIGSAIAGLAAAIIYALISPTFWALYVGSLVAVVLPVAGSWMVVRWIPSLPRRGRGTLALANYGAGVTGFNFVNFFARNLDNILIGRQWGDTQLGLYDRAYKLLLLPLSYITNPMGRVMLPALSGMLDQPERYTQAYLRAMGKILVVAIPGMAFMVGSADILVPTLLGPGWAEAAPIFAALGIAGLFQPLNNPSGWLYLSQGRTWDYMWAGMIGAATAVAGIIIGLPYGALGVALGYAISEVVRTPLIWWLATRRGPLRLHRVAAFAFPHIAGGILATGCTYAFASHVDLPPLLMLPACVCVAYAVSIAILSLSRDGRAELSEVIDLLIALAKKVSSLIRRGRPLD